MYDFECHYREERWQTAQYFDFVKDFLLAAQSREDSDDCYPPPCPTTSYTGGYIKGKYFVLLCLSPELVLWQPFFVAGATINCRCKGKLSLFHIISTA